MYYYPDELYHHGIKGQRWGVRNGPPYPLSPQTHASVVRSGGNRGRTRPVSRGRIGGVNNEEEAKRARRNKILKGVGIGLGAAALAGGAGYLAYRNRDALARYARTAGAKGRQGLTQARLGAKKIRYAAKDIGGRALFKGKRAATNAATAAGNAVSNSANRVATGAKAAAESAQTSARIASAKARQNAVQARLAAKQARYAAKDISNKVAFETTKAVSGAAKNVSSAVTNTRTGRMAAAKGRQGLTQARLGAKKIRYAAKDISGRVLFKGKRAATKAGVRANQIFRGSKSMEAAARAQAAARRHNKLSGMLTNAKSEIARNGWTNNAVATEAYNKLAKATRVSANKARRYSNLADAYARRRQLALGLGAGGVAALGGGTAAGISAYRRRKSRKRRR